MTAIVDIGNTAAKIGLALDSGEIVDIRVLENPGVEKLLTIFQDFAVEKVVIAGTAASATIAGFVQSLSDADFDVMLLHNKSPMPFASSYAKGEAGIDRLANVAAALEISGAPVVVIDAGTAITMEVVDPEGVFIGGAILPGLRLQANSLHAGTGRLPEIAFGSDLPAKALNTKDAIAVGIMHGVAGAIEHLVNSVRSQPAMAHARVLITGGDSNKLRDLIHIEELELIPELTLRGLHRISKFAP